MKHIIHAMNAYIGSKELFDQEGWVFEPKLDGFRAILYVNGDLEFFSRNDLSLNDKFPDLLGIRKNIQAKNCVLDGEIVSYNKNGVPHIAQLKKGHKAHFIVFDILMKDGVSLINLPLMERKRILEETVKNGSKIEKSFYTKNGKELWKVVIQKGFEGVMAKREDGKYSPGLRTKAWLKVKSLNTADCVILGYRSSARRSLSSLALGLYDEHGNLQYIGQVGTGFTEALIDELLVNFKPYEVDKVPIKGLSLKNIQWLKPHFVCEVAFLEFTADKKIRHSALKRMRPDKKPRQCTFNANVPPK